MDTKDPITHYQIIEKNNENIKISEIYEEQITNNKKAYEIINARDSIHKNISSYKLA